METFFSDNIDNKQLVLRRQLRAVHQKNLLFKNSRWTASAFTIIYSGCDVALYGSLDERLFTTIRQIPEGISSLS